jgi:Flp pilus assembly protein TadD
MRVGVDRGRIARAGGRPARRLALVALCALSTAGCLSRSPEVTGSLGAPKADPAAADAAWRRQAETLAARYASDPGDPKLALAYARALRATDQVPQAVAVLQQTAIRHPKDKALLAAYGKALADVGRFTEAAEVLENAHTPADPDWRVLSARGAVADQMDDHVGAQRYYEAALKIVPDEPTVLANLGLSYALAKRLDLAEDTLRRAAEAPGAGPRVRQNLALVLGLRAKFADAEAVLRRDLAPEEAAANVAAMRGAVVQPNAWKALRAAEPRGGAKRSAPTQG